MNAPTSPSWWAACRPFVSRAFRGRRFQRTAVASVLLAILTLAMSLGLALGNSRAARDFRVALSFETSTYVREYNEFVAIAESHEQYLDLLALRAQLVREGTSTDGPLSYVVEPALAHVRHAASTPAPAEYAELQTRSQALAARNPRTHSPYEYGYGSPTFPWNSPAETSRLKTIVDRNLIPEVELYASPLHGTDVVRMIGWVSAMAFSLLALVLAPLLATSQIAQEVHENTLQPLLGTALSPRRLALGLTSAPLATAGILAIPQVAFQVLAAPFSEHPGLVGLSLALTLVVGLGLCMSGQLVGLLSGKRRTPGIIGIALTLVLSIAWLFAFGMASHFDPDMLRAFAFLPQSAALYLGFESFAPSPLQWHSFDPNAHTFMGLERPSISYLLLDTVGAAILAFVAFRALERRIPDKTCGTLLRSEAALAAVVLAAILPWEANQTYVPTLVMFMPWLLLLVMARIPTGQSLAYRPSVLRVPALEYMTMLTVHAAAFELWRPVSVSTYVLTEPELAVAPVLWALGTAFLVAARMATKPVTLRAAIILAATTTLVIVELVAANSGDVMPSGMAEELGALLTTLFVALMLVLPALLIADLRRPHSPATA